jgi:molybdopterin-guanine dinucleotide biosynthesis protein A
MDSARIDGCSGALLAGGRARRLGGIAKGLLRVQGEPLAARSARLLRSLFDEVLLSADEPGPYAALGLPAVADHFRQRGAPGGLHAVLSAARSQWVFVAACDMPFLSEAGIRLLAARRGEAQVVLVRWRERREPLHAFWSRACLPILEERLAGGNPSLQELASALPCAEVAEGEWAAVDPQGLAFTNVNTPEDVARLGAQLP